MNAFCRLLPKCELHAHLNGSVRDQTIVELAKEQNIAISLDACKRGETTGDRTLAQCFAMFDVIYKVTATLAAVERIAFEMVEDFARENCIWLEMRTTPRATADFSAEEYVLAVKRGITAAVTGRDVIVKLILSINRAKSVAIAEQTVDLALKMQCDGIDLSGDPTVGDASAFSATLARARDSGLKLALHVGEVASRDEDTRALLDLRPHRVGHCVHLNDANRHSIIRMQTPIEMVTSEQMRAANLLMSCPSV
jgi:adenosine deaminase